MYVTHYATYEAGENDEISIIAIAFNTNEPNYMNNLNVTIHRHNTKYAMTKFRQMPLLLLPMSQNMLHFVEISQVY